MTIINQWATDHVEYHSDPIKIKEHDNEYDIIVACKKIASSKDKNLIERLYHRLVHFADRYRRDTDTFDVGREIEFILNAKGDSGYGSYFS